MRLALDAGEVALGREMETVHRRRPLPAGRSNGCKERRQLEGLAVHGDGGAGVEPETCAPRLVEREPAAREITPRRIGGGDGRRALQEPRLGFGLTFALRLERILTLEQLVPRVRHRERRVAVAELARGRTKRTRSPGD